MAINRILISCPFFLGGVQRTLHILMFIVFCSSPTQTFPKTPRSHQWVRDARQPPAIFRIFDGQHPETSASPNKKTTTAKPQVANKANKLCYPPQKLTANATFNIGFWTPKRVQGFFPNQQILGVACVNFLFFWRVSGWWCSTNPFEKNMLVKLGIFPK